MSVLSRRDFLRLRTTERGRVLEVSCHTLFMRCADGGLEHADAVDWEPWMGEPPAVLHRRSADAVLDALETEMQGVQVVRLVEPEWLDGMPGGDRVQAMTEAFLRRGGVVEPARPTPSPA